MPQNAGKHVSESFKFQIFAGGARPRTPRGVCCSATRRACYASTIHFSLLLSSDQTPITFSIDNPECLANAGQITRMLLRLEKTRKVFEFYGEVL